MFLRSGKQAFSLIQQAAPIHLAAHLGIAVAGGLTPLAIAWPTKLLVDRLGGDSPRWNEVAWLAVLVAGAGVVASQLPHVDQYLRAEIDRRERVLATSRLYEAVDGFVGLSRFEDPAFLDRLQLARSSGVGAPVMLAGSFLSTLQALLTIGSFAGALLALGPWFAVVVVLAGAMPALFAELGLSRRRAATVATTSQAERRELFYAGLLSDPRAAKEVRLFGAGPFLWRRMSAEMRNINVAYRRIDMRTLAVQGALSLLGAVVAGGLLLWTVRSVVSKALTVGDVVLVVAAVGSVQASLSSLISSAVAAHQSLLLFSHYNAVVEAPLDLPIPPQPIPTTPLRNGIELRDVWFRYSDDQPWVLRGLSLFLPAHRTLAVVGLNGAGKTTLVKLLCRLYDPSRGAVLWDGVDVRNLDPIELRRRIRAVFQDAAAYDLTAAENIAIGDLESSADRSRIEAAAKQAGVHDLITGLPKGYDTLLSRTFFSEANGADSRSGVTLSGGQWQRLALARGLLLQNPDLLILDEPSSSLDAEAEHEVHTQLRAYRAGRTSLLVSHRLGVVREADQIVVLSAGEIVESGQHDELIRRDGAYARLFTLQAAGYRSATPTEVA